MNNLFRNLRRVFGRFWYLFAIAIMLAVFMTVATNKDGLDLYTNGPSTYTVEPESESEKQVNSVTYRNKEVEMTLSVPEGWDYVLKDGFDTFIHSESASSIQVQVLNYYPQVNNVTQQSLSESYAIQGKAVTEFSFISNNGYYLIYQTQGISGITDCIEMVQWDRLHVVKLAVIFNDIYYDKLKDEIWYCIDSMSWQYESPIPEEYVLYYQIDGDFEYAVPSGWVTGMSGDTLYASDSTTGSFMTVNVLDDVSSVENISQLDYVNFLSSGKQDFVLTQYSQTENTIYGEATYMQDNTMVSLMQYYIANGTYHYILTFECPTEIGGDIMPLAQGALELTRVFFKPDEGTDNETETETENTDAKEMETSTETTVQEHQTSTEETSESETEQTSVSSFSEAIVNITGIPYEKADSIAGIWDQLQAGTPVYAEAVKESSDTVVILVETAQDFLYYLFVGKDGELQTIRLGSEDGNIIWQ